MVLNDGLEFKETTSTSVEMQLNENIQTNNEEICSLFGLAPEVISGKATAEQFANAVRTAVQPILESLQCALNRNLLLESEKGKMYFAFDTTELLKGGIKRICRSLGLIMLNLDYRTFCLMLRAGLFIRLILIRLLKLEVRC